MTHSRAGHDACGMWDMTHSDFMRSNSSTATWYTCEYMCGTHSYGTRSHVGHDASTHVTCSMHTEHDLFMWSHNRATTGYACQNIRGTHSYGGHDSFTRGTCLVRILGLDSFLWDFTPAYKKRSYAWHDVTHSNMRREAFTYGTQLYHICDIYSYTWGLLKHVLRLWRGDLSHILWVICHISLGGSIAICVISHTP